MNAKILTRDIFRVMAILGMLIYVAVSVVKFNIEKSPICDEVSHHIAAGYSYVKLGDYRMNPATPSLIRTLTGLPLLAFSPRLPDDDVSWQKNDSPTFGRLFLYGYGNDAEKIVFWSRFPILIVSLFLALLVYAWAKALYGYKAGLLAMFLYSFSPEILGNSGLAMSDIGGAACIFFAICSFWLFVKRPDMFRIVLAGVFIGLAQASKHTAVLLIPLTLFFGFAARRPLSGPTEKALVRFWKMAGIYVIAFMALWYTYSFEFQPLLATAPDVDEKVNYIAKIADKVPFVGGKDLADKMIGFAREKPIPMPTFFISLLGVSNQVVTEGQPLFFNGERYHRGGNPIYCAVLFLIKTSLPVIILLLISVAAACRKMRTARDSTDSLFLLLPALTMFVVFSLSHVQGGIRYLLPIYPFLFVWASDTVNVRFEKRRLNVFKNAVLSALIVWHAWGCIRVGPDYLAFFNELAGGPDGKVYRKICRDMDWGQDLKALAKYLKDKDIDNVKLAYFGTASPEFYGIRYSLITNEEQKNPDKKVYAISVLSYDNVEWNKNISPTAKAGRSILIYDFRDEAVGR